MSDPTQALQQVAQAVQHIPVWAEWVSKLATPLIALIAAGYTALQYERTRKWRAKDIAARLVDQLATDDELAFACQALDWGCGPMIVPVRYRPLLARRPADPDNSTPQEQGEIMNHDPALMAKALEVRVAPGLKDEPAGLIYRYCFDKLFSHLSNIYRLQVDGQVKIEDLDSSRYWIGKIANYRFGPIEKRGGLMFQPFLGYEPFGYQGVRELGKKLGIKGWLPKPQPRKSDSPPRLRGVTFGRIATDNDRATISQI
jgi:hypothetical protein